ncbi:hypothetical protein T492DRAFT_609963 [Pavlovales sp. CCMP2436]|nr:hypothetical protein T492DRAFT_609963 [Pavlovales sp. CCMP2436]
MSSLSEEIARQTASKKPAEVKELVLDKCTAAKLDGGEFDGYTSLEFLSLNSVGLTSLDNFPSLMRLKRLELNDNKISGGLEVLQNSSLISLSVLSLSGNRIKALEDLAALGGLPSLKQLDLEMCDVAQLADYREKVFEMIPQLKLLDNADANGEEGEDDDDDDDDDDEDDDDLDEDGDDDVAADEDGDLDDEEEEGEAGNEAPAAEGDGESDEAGDDEEDEEEDDEEEGEEEGGGKRPRVD